MNTMCMRLNEMLRDSDTTVDLTNAISAATWWGGKLVLLPFRAILSRAELLSEIDRLVGVTRRAACGRLSESDCYELIVLLATVPRTNDSYLVAQTLRHELMLAA